MRRKPRGANLRRAPRQPAGWRSRYAFEGAPEREWDECRVIDVSATGAALELFGARPDRMLQHRVVVELVVASGEPAGLQVRGVIRNHSDGDEGGYRVGIEFLDVGTLQREMLDDLLDRQHV